MEVHEVIAGLSRKLYGGEMPHLTKISRNNTTKHQTPQYSFYRPSKSQISLNKNASAFSSTNKASFITEAKQGFSRNSRLNIGGHGDQASCNEGFCTVSLPQISKTELKNYLTKSKDIGVSEKLKITKLYEKHYTNSGTLQAPIRRIRRRNRKIAVLEPKIKKNQILSLHKNTSEGLKKSLQSGTPFKAMLPNVSNLLYPNSNYQKEIERLYEESPLKHKRSTFLDYKRRTFLPPPAPSDFKHDARKGNISRKQGRLYKLRHLSKTRS
ncbi:unnamed protein product [Moneuplotes crassus]|uniref:Uncharacterized protein n=1 Tax=Euplotes crassus TaxID=5936 RepID=A0AAD1U2P2_EUPCR|nr:unnamed protein product [Moneuplotes crassus]